MSEAILIAVIASTPPTIAAVLGYVANRRSLRRSVGDPPEVSLIELVERVELKLDRLDTKFDTLSESQSLVRERLARLEAAQQNPMRGSAT
jgi:chaperonin cofactor prefoldin